LQGEHIRAERADALTHFGLGGGGFDAAPGRGVIEIVFNIVTGDAENGGLFLEIRHGVFLLWRVI
jgi:hypothetical protein